MLCCATHGTGHLTDYISFVNNELMFTWQQNYSINAFDVLK